LRLLCEGFNKESLFVASEENFRLFPFEKQVVLSGSASQEVMDPTPTKQLIVFSNLLCKQGTAGSSPATSTSFVDSNTLRLPEFSASNAGVKT